MTSIARIALAGGLLAVVAGSANATTVDFSFLNGGTTIATGAFSYSGVSGVLGYGDLSSFKVTVAGVSYDLAFALASHNYNYFAFDTATQSFVAGIGDGEFGPTQELLGAFADDIASGYFFAPDGNFSEITTETNGGTFDTTTITTTAVVEPAALSLLAFGVAGLGVVRRRALCA